MSILGASKVELRDWANGFQSRTMHDLRNESKMYFTYVHMETTFERSPLMFLSTHLCKFSKIYFTQPDSYDVYWTTYKKRMLSAILWSTPKSDRTFWVRKRPANCDYLRIYFVLIKVCCSQTSSIWVNTGCCITAPSRFSAEIVPSVPLWKNLPALSVLFLSILKMDSKTKHLKWLTLFPLG